MSSVCQAWEENMQILHVSILSWIKSSKGVADKGTQIFTARGRGRGREEEWCDHSRNSDRCVWTWERQTGRDETLLLSLPVEMKMVKGEENARTAKMERCSTKRQYEKEGFVCIPLEEMESYYRYSQCCQQLQHSELLCISCVRCGSVSDRTCWVSVGMEIMTVTSMKHWTGTSSNDHISSLTLCGHNLSLSI